MSQKINYIDIKEFREKGYLQEVNRQFFHPLGLAMSIEIDEDGNETLGGIWDYRDDPEGIRYADAETQKDKEERYRKMKYVADERAEKIAERKRRFGWGIQPIEKPKKNE